MSRCWRRATSTLPPAGHRSTRPAGRTVAMAAGALALALTGCAEPELPEGPLEDTGTSPAPEADDADDPDLGQLADQLDAVAAAVDAAVEHLESAAAADGTSQLRVDAHEALGRLLEDAGTGSSIPLLPADTPEREAIGDRNDLLNATLAAARDVGGEAGSAVVDLLREDLAGDLGAWERDAAGMVAQVERAATQPGDIEQRTERILDLPGEATRALAWTLVATDVSDLHTASTAATRAIAHLDLVRSAVAELAGELPNSGGDL